MCTNCGRVFIFRQFDHELIPKKKKKNTELKKKKIFKSFGGFLKEICETTGLYSFIIPWGKLFICVLLKCVAYFVILS